MPRRAPDTPVSTTGLTPQTSRAFPLLSRPAADTGLSDALSKAAAILDPTADGALGRFVKFRERQIQEAVEREYLRDEEVAELQILERNPLLRGAATSVGRHLDHLRGQTAATRAWREAEVAFASEGPEGREPGLVKDWLTQRRNEVLAQSGLAEDGQSSFLTLWAERQRRFEDQAVGDHIDAVERKHQGEYATTIREMVAGAGEMLEAGISGVDQDYASQLGGSKSLALTFGIQDAEADNVIQNAISETIGQNPLLGGDLYRVAVEQGVVTDQPTRARWIDLANAADAAAARARDIQLDELEAAEENFGEELILEMVQSIERGDRPSEFVSQFRPRLGSVPASQAKRVTDAYSSFLGTIEKGDTYAISGPELAALEIEYRRGVRKLDDLVSDSINYSLSRDALERMSAAARSFENDGGITQAPVVADIRRRLERLSPKDEFGSAIDPNIEEAVQDGVDELNDFVRRKAQEEPSWRGDPEQQSKDLSDWLRSFREDALPTLRARSVLLGNLRENSLLDEATAAPGTRQEKIDALTETAAMYRAEREAALLRSTRRRQSSAKQAIMLNLTTQRDRTGEEIWLDVPTRLPEDPLASFTLGFENP